MFALLNALLAYFMWGLFPIYWNQIHSVHSYDLISLRILISLVSLFPAMYFRKTIKEYFKTLKNKKMMGLLFMSGFLISLNWTIYIYAITNNHIVESALGYFITPLINILFGILFLKEKLGKFKIIAFLFALTGISLMIYKTGSIPLLSIVISISFALYALTRKKIPVPPLVGLALEISWFALPAFLYLFFYNQTNYSAVTNYEWVFISLSGFATILPLVCFNHAVKGLPLSTVGLIQYISPTLQFLSGVYIFGEPFNQDKLISFSFIWAGLLVISIHALFNQYKIKKHSLMQPK